MYKNQKGSHILGIILIIVVLGIVGLVGLKVLKSDSKKSGNTGSAPAKTVANLGSLKTWANDCTGSGSVKMTSSPMDLNDTESIIPLGTLAGAHVTPIDHLYYYPKDMKNRDATAVRAMADGYIVDFSERTQNIDSGASKKGEYRIVIQHTCDFYSYFDLMTSMDASIKAQIDKGNRHIPVKAGQELGRVGGQSLDTAVYNFSMTLPGFINLDSYKAEPWKAHTDDFFSYFDEPLLGKMLAINPRKVKPYSGKIDYDVAGKLSGNWFQEGTNGYEGPAEFKNGAPANDGRGYWSGHFSIAPEAVNPSRIAISLGNFNGKATQFIAKSNTPDPAMVDVTSGVVKYELGEYRLFGGAPYATIVSMTSMADTSAPKGTLLVQVLDGEKLKLEAFPGKKASEVTGFTSSAKTYVR